MKNLEEEYQRIKWQAYTRAAQELRDYAEECRGLESALIDFVSWSAALESGAGRIEQLKGQSDE